MKTFLRYLIIPKIVVLGLGIMFNDEELLKQGLYIFLLNWENITWVIDLIFSILPNSLVEVFSWTFSFKWFVVDALSYYCGFAIVPQIPRLPKIKEFVSWF